MSASLITQQKIIMSSSNTPSKAHGNVVSAMGSVKENVGSAIGNHSMQANGAAERAKGNAEVESAKAAGYAAGTVDHATGNVKKNLGSVLGNEQMKTEGAATEISGKAQKKVNE